MAERQSRAITTIKTDRTDHRFDQNHDGVVHTQSLQRVLFVGVHFLLLACLFYIGGLHAQADIGAIKSNLSDADASKQVTWAQLTDEQRKVLAPLGKEWNTLRPWQREKMLDIARDYPKMDAKKQERVQQRLNVWSRMTPYERENARKRYQQFHNLSPEKKDELRKKWAEHSKLPESQRQKLRQEYADEYDPELD